LIFYFQPAKKIIFVFLVLTLVSSLSAAAFVTGNNNVNLAFAKKHHSGSSGGGSGSSGGGSGSSDNSGGSAPPATDNSGGSAPPATTDNTPTPPQTCSDGSAPASDGTCPSTTPSPPPTPAPAVDCNATPDDPSCPTNTNTTTTLAPTEQNTAPKTLIKQTCPPQPIDASGQCPGVDLRGGGLGLPPPPQGTCPPLPIDANGNCPGVDMRGGGLGLPPPPQAHFNLPPNVMVKPILSDGSCQAGYHIDNGNCAIDSVHKLPNGNCPVGAIMTTTNICVTTPVLPGSTTGPGGGFIQMIPQR
jgi:hypothetical protein